MDLLGSTVAAAARALRVRAAALVAFAVAASRPRSDGEHLAA